MDSRRLQISQCTHSGMIKFDTGTGVLLVVSDGSDFGVGAPILLFNMDESRSYELIGQDG